MDVLTTARDTLRLKIVVMLSMLEINRATGTDLRRVIARTPSRPEPSDKTSTEFLQFTGDKSPVQWVGDQRRSAPSDWDAMVAQQAGQLRDLAVKSLVMEVITPDMYRAIVRSIDGKDDVTPNPSAVVKVDVAAPDIKFGEGSIQVPVTVRPIIDMTADKIIDYDRSGTPIGIRRAS